MRIIDNNGYEYRTNAQGGVTFFDSEISINEFIGTEPFLTFNFNKEAGITFSDVVGITTLRFRDEDLAVPLSYDAQDVGNTFYPMDIDIYNLNEVPFSCRNIIFSCVDQDNPRLEELLENAGSASVASFEYGINDAIPHSKGGELLCPGNNIEEGFVRLTPLNIPASVIDNLQSKENILEPFTPTFYGYIGLNNGNGRGSFDSFWVINPLSVLIGS